MLSNTLNGFRVISCTAQQKVKAGVRGTLCMITLRSKKLQDPMLQLIVHKQAARWRPSPDSRAPGGDRVQTPEPREEIESRLQSPGRRHRPDRGSWRETGKHENSWQPLLSDMHVLTRFSPLRFSDKSKPQFLPSVILGTMGAPPYGSEKLRIICRMCSL
ncbi:hypothetical protein EYF80_051266 [Liparis tanakae]|uniref:Uncharacterized protein n=1 Tax=Liparis tanakae TaxID=230148 RepID=A0A4Z2FCR8_9TELE|nr:hypothetical protein EYF80_051266 [Liparis tanakae]